MSHVYAAEYIAAKVRAGGKLEKKGKDQVSAVLLINIPEVEVIVSYRCQSSIAQCHNILNDRRASN